MIPVAGDPVRAALERLVAADPGSSWIGARTRSLREKAPGRPAAVLMLFGHGEPPRTPGGRRLVRSLAARPEVPRDLIDADVLLLQRASGLRNHAGQVAFPGGGVDPGDADISSTALREAEEETGLDPSGVEIVGTLPEIPVIPSGFQVTPVVGWWREASPIRVVDEGESASVLRVPVADLVSPENRGSYRNPRGYSTPAFDAGVLTVWGFTAGLLDFALDALGWAVPWDAARSIELR